MIEVEIKDKNVRSLLKRVQSRLGRLKPAMNLIGEIVYESIQRNFEVGGRPDPWAPLSPVTIAQRQKKGKWPGSILIRRGVAGGLLGSISYKADDDQVTLSANKIYAPLQHFGAEKGKFGTVLAQVKAHVRNWKGKSVRVKAHQRKTTIPWGDIPSRKFMMVQDADWDEIKAELADFLTGRA